ncbi:MAG: ROK family protein [Anaerolineae bacterium]|nr:ROK family protein [Anaerolineae bacterium]
MSNDVYIGIDLGGTRVRAGRFSSDLKLEQRIETLTRPEDGVEAVLDRMVQQAQAVWPTDARVAGVGISAPGPIDLTEGVISSAPNLKQWHNVPLRRILQERLGATTYLGNDANLAALAEHAMGVGKGYKHLIYLTISTGIGGGVIIDDRMLVGSRGFAAELGHTYIIVADENKPTRLENEAAGPAIAKQAQAAIERGEQTIITSMVESIDSIDARMVGEAARAGDKVALRIIERAGRIIGLGVLNYLHIFNPEIVVIGGGVAKGTWSILHPQIIATIQKYSIDVGYWDRLKVVEPTLGEDVALVGAAALALRQGAQ